MKFKIKIEEDEDGWYVATVPALPGCISQGKTEEEAKKNIAEAIESHLSALAEDGVPVEYREGVKEAFVMYIYNVPVASGKDVIKALSKIGYYVRDRKGSHVHLRHPYRKPLTVSDHSDKRNFKSL